MSLRDLAANPTRLREADRARRTTRDFAELRFGQAGDDDHVLLDKIGAGCCGLRHGFDRPFGG